MIYQMKITLEHVAPPIWRRIQIDPERTFAELHDIIQTVMGWENSHLYNFRFKHTTVSPQDDGDFDLFGGTNLLSDDETTLSELFGKEKKCIYTYDFGDDWRHTVQLEKKLEAEPGARYPKCTGGARSCPPEDCGGAWGYSSLLNIISDPSHPEYEERREWLLGCDFDEEAPSQAEWDPEHFDINEVNAELESLVELYEPESDAPAPTMEQWRRLFEIACKIKVAKPWANLTDADYIAVQPAGYAEPVFYSTMGSLGQCVAIAAHFGTASIARLEKIRMNTAESASPFTVLGTQDCIICYFGDREELSKEDRDILRDLGIKFRGRGEWIFFRSVKPGYAPWHINSAEAELLCDTFEQYLAAYEDYLSGKFKVDFESGGLMLRKHAPLAHREKWENHVAYLTGLRFEGEQIEITDNLYIARLKKMKKNSSAIELDMLYMPAPVQEHKCMRPYYPQVVLLAERESGAILGQKVLSPDADNVGAILDLLHELVIAHGRPRSIYVRDDEMAAITGDFCAKLDIRLEIGRPMHVMDEAIESMMAFMGFSGFDDEE